MGPDELATTIASRLYGCVILGPTSEEDRKIVAVERPNAGKVLARTDKGELFSITVERI